MLQLFKMLCVISSEEAVKLHDGNRSQFAKIFHVIANTADGKQKVDVAIERSGFGSGRKCCGIRIPSVNGTGRNFVVPASHIINIQTLS